VHQRLDIETLGGHDLSNVFIGKLLQNRGLSGVVKTENQQTSLLVGLQTTSSQVHPIRFSNVRRKEFTQRTFLSFLSKVSNPIVDDYNTVEKHSNQT
jgi:hypothetical protein